MGPRNRREGMQHEGIPLLADTDALRPIEPNTTLAFGDTLLEEMQHSVETVGIEPAEAINAATSVAAKYHRLYDRGDPPEDVRNKRDVVGMWVEGRFTGAVGRKGVVGAWSFQDFPCQSYVLRICMSMKSVCISKE
jgi:hypothetical protein